MTPSSTPWVFIPLLTFALGSVLAVQSMRQRGEPGTRALLAFGIALVAAALAQAGAGFTQADSSAAFLLAIGVSVGLIPAAWLWFALDFTDHMERLQGPLGALIAVPALTLILALTQSFHPVLDGFPRSPVGAAAVGWQGVHYAAAVGSIMVATVTLLRYHARGRRFGPHRLAGMTSAVVGVTALVFSAMGWYAPGGIDLAPAVLALSGAILAWGLARPGLLRLAPVARSEVVDVMEDLVLVLDRRARVVDLNRSAERHGFEPGRVVPSKLSIPWMKDLFARGSRPVNTHRVPLPVTDPKGGADAEEVERIFDVTVSTLGLQAGLPYGVLVLRDVTQQERLQAGIRETSEALHKANAELERLANTDALTGLANRRQFFARLEEEVDRVRRYDRTASLIFLDLDHFKEVNDTHGHPAGDRTLRGAAAALHRVCRDVDLPGRIGGEEFAILLPETDVDGAAAVAERVRRLIELQSYPGSGDEDYRVTASLGVAGFGDNVTSTDALVSAADDALYQAKDAGRNRVVVAGPGHPPT